MSIAFPKDPPAGGFEIIVADPPWSFTSNSHESPGKNARRHYPCMNLDEIANLPVKEIAARDSLLFLWTTVPFALLSARVIEAWGFTYKSQLAWVKERLGTGFWARNRHEIVYICRRGKFPCPKGALFQDSVIQGGQRRHSRKPDYLMDRLDEAYPGANKIELFARDIRSGWHSWGDELVDMEGII